MLSAIVLQSIPLKLPDVRLVIEFILVSKVVLKEFTPAFTEFAFVV